MRQRLNNAAVASRAKLNAIRPRHEVSTRPLTAAFSPTTARTAGTIIWAGGLPQLDSVSWSATLEAPVAEPIVVTAPQSQRGHALREVARNLRAAAETNGDKS